MMHVGAGSAATGAAAFIDWPGAGGAHKVFT
jgi:hypothetical protein